MVLSALTGVINLKVSPVTEFSTGAPFTLLKLRLSMVPCLAYPPLYSNFPENQFMRLQGEMMDGVVFENG